MPTDPRPCGAHAINPATGRPVRCDAGADHPLPHTFPFEAPALTLLEDRFTPTDPVRERCPDRSAAGDLQCEGRPGHQSSHHAYIADYPYIWDAAGIPYRRCPSAFCRLPEGHAGDHGIPDLEPPDNPTAAAERLAALRTDETGHPSGLADGFAEAAVGLLTDYADNADAGDAILKAAHVHAMLSVACQVARIADAAERWLDVLDGDQDALEQAKATAQAMLHAERPVWPTRPEGGD